MPRGWRKASFTTFPCTEYIWRGAVRTVPIIQMPVPAKLEAVRRSSTGKLKHFKSWFKTILMNIFFHIIPYCGIHLHVPYHRKPWAFSPNDERGNRWESPVGYRRCMYPCIQDKWRQRHVIYVKMPAWVRPRPLEKRGLVSFLPGIIQTFL